MVYLRQTVLVLASSKLMQAETHFGGANLTTANFMNARNAYFERAIFKDTIMPDGSLRSN
ncbi:MAG: hypothetical protein KME29_31940 [Calothrix sp. FI2-JRJ7]|jgi:uncharacterized protein YjbI with pentapeptide repeats|nr:hypothetical protein [Calothrix sp. FI2-JRJ7]